MIYFYTYIYIYIYIYIYTYIYIYIYACISNDGARRQLVYTCMPNPVLYIKCT